MSQSREDREEIEIITGDDSELDVSPVYDHLNLDKPRKEPEKKNIIIPEVKKDKKN